MKDLSSLIARVRELDGKATKAPWIHNQGDTDEALNYDWIGDAPSGVHSKIILPRMAAYGGRADVQLIAEFRTLAPQLASECERLQKELQEAHRHHLQVQREAEQWRQQTEHWRESWARAQVEVNTRPLPDSAGLKITSLQDALAQALKERDDAQSALRESQAECERLSVYAQQCKNSEAEWQRRYLEQCDELERLAERVEEAERLLRDELHRIHLESCDCFIDGTYECPDAKAIRVFLGGAK